MPQPGVPAGPRSHRRRKPRGRKVSPTGPYLAEAGSRKARGRASAAERRRLSQGKGRTARRVRRLARRDREEAAQAKRDAVRATKAVRKATASKPIETLRKAEAKIERTKDRKLKAQLRESAKRLRHALAAEAAFKASRKTPEGSPVKADFPEPALKSVAPRAYRKALKAAQAGGHGSSRGLGEPEDLTTAITVLAPGGGAVGALGKKAVEVGGKKVLEDIGEYAAGKAESAGGKAGLKAVRAGSAVRAGGRLAGNVARRAAGRETVKASESAARAAAERAIARGESRAAGATVPGLKLGKVALGQSLPVVKGHEQALVENPKAVAKRTAIGAEGLVLGPAKAAIDVGTTTGRAASSAAHELGIPGARGYSGEEILAPVAGLGKEQIAFARQVAKVVTASDPDYVQKEVEDNLGLMLPIMLGLGSKAAADKLGKGRIVEGVRRLADRARREPLGDFRGETPRVLEKQGQHKAEARRVAVARARARRDEQGATGRYVARGRRAKGGEVVRRQVRDRKGRFARAGRRGLAREEARGSLVVRPADIVPFATRHSIDLSDPARAIEQVRAVRGSLKPLPEGARLPKGKLHTRDLLDYIEANADILADPDVRAALEERRRAGAYRREHAAELEPEHSERARYSSVAVVKGRPFPEEMFPGSVRSIVRAEPERGRLAKDVLRREARRDRSRGRALRKKATTVERKAAIMRRELETREKLNKGNLELPLADWQVRELKAVKELERRGQVPKCSAPVGGHLEIVTPREGRLPRNTLPALHDRLRDRIDRLDAQAVDLRERAALADQMAAQKHKAAQGFDPALEREFVEREAAALRAEGRPQPEYVHTGRAREAPAYGGGAAKLSNVPGRSKFRKGTAEEYGMVEEGLVPDVRESFRRPITRRESYKAMRGMLGANEFRAGDKAEWTSDEIRELFDEKVLNRNQWVAIPRQLYRRAYGKFDPEAAAAEIKLALDGSAPGSHFKLVRRAAAEEFFSQLSDNLLSSKLVKANRATNFLILSTSPAWAAAQIAAEYVQGSIAQPKLLNPKWVRRAIRAYKSMSPHKRQAFDSWVGVTARELNRKEEIGFGRVEDAADAYSALHATPLGRVLTSLRDFDQWKGGRIRALVTIAKADTELNGHLRGFLGGLGRLDQSIGSQLEAMRGKPLHDQLSYIAEHPELADRYQGYLDDVMGNWSALTKNERVASQLLIFYPFLRMSLRWTFWAFPKEHPIRAAVLTYLSQQNATEIKRLLGGDPSYFTDWLKVPVDLGEGKRAFVPLARIVPGASAPLEAVGGGVEGPKGTVALRTLQPTLGAAATLATGVDPLSGKQEKGSFWQALEALFPTNLSAPGRALDEAILPGGRKPADGFGRAVAPIFGNTERQDAVDKLSAKLRGYGTGERYLRNLAVPVLPEDGARVQDGELLGRVLNALHDNSSTARKETSVDYAGRVAAARTEGDGKKARRLLGEGARRLKKMKGAYDQANDLLDGLLRKYGIPFQKEDEAFLDAYGRLYYGNKPDTPDGPPRFTAGSTGGGPTIVPEGAPTTRSRARARRRRGRGRPAPAGPTIIGPLP